MGIAEGSAVTTPAPLTSPEVLTPSGGRKPGSTAFATSPANAVTGNSGPQHHFHVGFNPVPTVTTTTCGGATGGSDEVKPRSLRFTWSMKTTSSLAPEEMMRLVSLLKIPFSKLFLSSSHPRTLVKVRIYKDDAEISLIFQFFLSE